MKLKEIAITVFALVLIGAIGYLWFSPSGLKAMPSVAVDGLDGHKLDLAQYRGRPLLVTFWSTDCPGCVEEMPHLVKLYNELGPKGFNLVAIAMAGDVPKQVRIMKQERHLSYTIGIDSDGSAAKAFGDVQLTPTSFLINPQGRIVQQKVGNLDFTKLRSHIQGMLGQQGAGA